MKLKFGTTAWLKMDAYTKSNFQDYFFRDALYYFMKIFDPDRILRKKRSLHRRQYKYIIIYSDKAWHIDKLKQYGIVINGCIDRFLRNIFWIEANSATDKRLHG